MTVATAAPAFAHAGHHHGLEVREILTWWSWEPLIIIALAISGALYAIGHAKVRWWEAVAFAMGWLSLVIALVSPVDVLGSILFSAHMVQHELLMVVAAPLLVLGRPLVAFLWALPARWRTRVGGWAQTRAVATTWRFVTAPAIATIVHGITLWSWHLPSLYEATLRSDFVHALQHASFLFTATLFWWSLLHGRYGRIGYGVAVAYVFFTAVHSGALGALITFSPNLWYPIYQSTTAKWGLDAIEDQQLAGLIMWIPAGVLLTVAAIGLVAGWLAEAERRVAMSSSDMLRKEKS